MPVDLCPDSLQYEPISHQHFSRPDMSAVYTTQNYIDYESGDWIYPILGLGACTTLMILLIFSQRIQQWLRGGRDA